MGCAGSKQVGVSQNGSSTVSTPGGTQVPLLDTLPTNKAAAKRVDVDGPVSFSRAGADITLAEGGAVATMTGWDGGVVASAEIMSEGKHCVEFTVIKGEYLYLGAMAADWDVGNGSDVEQAEQGGCFYSTNGGKCYPSGEDWDGSQSAKEEGDRIGLLLDLDDRCMTMYKNGERL
eukprot:COSAG02_NODE_13706_length_1359_cov_0.989683_1_plen_174_part_10